MSYKNYGWYEKIESTARYFQSDFIASKILRKSSDYNDILNRKIQTMRVKSNDRLVISEK